MIKQFVCLILSSNIIACAQIADIQDVRLDYIDSGVYYSDAHVDDAPSEVSSLPISESSTLIVTGPTGTPNAGSVYPSAPCNEQPAGFVFCDDFDSDPLVYSKWDFPTNGMGTISLSAIAYTSPTQSLHAVGGTGSGQAAVGKTFGSFASQITLSFDFWVNSGDFSTLPGFGVAQIEGQPITADSDAAVPEVSIDLEYTKPTGFQVQAYLSGTSSPPMSIPIPSPALGSWTRIVIHYSVTSGLTVFENGIAVASNSNAVAGGLKTVLVQIGDVYEIPPGTQSVDINIDNVVLSGG